MEKRFVDIVKTFNYSGSGEDGMEWEALVLCHEARVIERQRNSGNVDAKVCVFL